MKIEYSKEFIVRKCGVHAGPILQIDEIYKEYNEKINEDLKINFVKTYCPYGFGIGKIADRDSITELMSFMGVQGSKIKVIVSTSSEEEDKDNLLEKCVLEIGGY